jgi:small subunit ribosomal protein S17
MMMADEEKNETTEETPEAEAPAEEQAPEAEAPPEEAPAEDAPAEEEAPAAEDAAPADDPEEGLNWKTRQRLAKSRQSGEAGPQLTPEDRAKARAESRAAAIKSRGSYRRKQREKHQKGEGTAPVEHESAGRKERQGRVVSDKANKTITVRIDVARRHPTYEKIVRTSNTLHAHDESNEAGEGDLVKIVETRPLSKTKRWRLVEVMEKAK